MALGCFPKINLALQFSRRGGRSYVAEHKRFLARLFIMSLTQVQLNKLTKDEVIAFTLEVQEKYNEKLHISEKLEQAINDISLLQKTVEDLCKKNVELESSLAVSKNVNDQLLKRVVDLERQTNANSQYSRRECLEISGIPKKVDDDNLEAKVCEIFSSIDVEVSTDRVEACHRLKNNRTIIKFSNRKDCVKVLKNRSKLKVSDKTVLGFDKDTKIYVNESLCPAYRFLLWKVRQLMDGKKVYSYWTFNGIIKIKISDVGKIHAITHIADLKELFPNIDFSKEEIC